MTTPDTRPDNGRDAGFDCLAALLRARAGLELARSKTYLVESRLGPLARAHGCVTVSAFLESLARDGIGDALAADLVEAMLNNETFFFRDIQPFDLLRQRILPQLRAARAASRRIRIWSAAASTGQEPYSVAMLFAEDRASWEGWTIDIVGTDISRRAVARARSGLYSQFEVQRGLSIHRLMAHFEKTGEHWALSPDIRAMVRFQPLNLLGPWSLGAPFDIILCRNVLMYLAHDCKQDVLARIHRHLNPDGRLILGAAETVLGVTNAFVPDWQNRGLYLPAPVPQTPAFARAV
ncbi:CheR family methyltransferase [Sphingosinicella microcystinivorans]|uniref:CheR family methyltransferase n=1 Tax=Sphingosinicella microcystinivorans TaxID=335406 RepID=UPI0022F3CFF0|nr:protein-glutamate O-methyltransferase CheR [Sphingosinicella microcystinivorans]WBX84324.1 protein-glutamate O-methyltransferase CheR [Sphingosinicella microcystinivorans]